MDAATFIQNYEHFSPNSRLWVYQADRLLQQHEVDAIQQQINAFTAQWQAHGASLKAVGAVLYKSLIVLMVDETLEPASGCSIDSSVHFIKNLKEKYQLDFFDRNQIAYIDDSKTIRLIGKKNANEIVNSLVFNTSVTSFAEFQQQFIIPFKESAFARIDTESTFSLRL